MTYSDPIGTMNCAMNGTSMCVAAIRELWAKPKIGDPFPVHSIVDETTPDLPWYSIRVTDYRGHSCDFSELSRESQCELVNFAIEQLYEHDGEMFYRI